MYDYMYSLNSKQWPRPLPDTRSERPPGSNPDACVRPPHPRKVANARATQGHIHTLSLLELPNALLRRDLKL
jgi:hypothetical protein